MEIGKFASTCAAVFTSFVFLCSCSATAEQDSAAPRIIPTAEISGVEQSALPDADNAAHAADNPEAYTAYADYDPQPQQPIDLVKGTNPDVLVAYFSHASNTVVPAGSADAVTSASIIRQDNGTSVGNSQIIADWIAELTGGDLYAIQTTYTYPQDYDALVSVGEGQDIDGILPAMLTHPENLEQYSYVYLVSPVWHFSMPAPVRSFLLDNDLSGKTIFAFAVNAGSSFGSMIEELEQYEPGADILEGISVNQNNVLDSKPEVSETVRSLMEQTGETAPTQTPQSPEQEATAMDVTIGDTTFQAELADTDAAREFAAMLADGPVTIDMRDYSGFEKVGPIGRSLTATNTQITTQPGDIVLYNGDQMVMFYGSNTWDYTPIAKIRDLTGWTSALGDGDITAFFRLSRA